MPKRQDQPERSAELAEKTAHRTARVSEMDGLEIEGGTEWKIRSE
jgi:hypothetical protein